MKLHTTNKAIWTGSLVGVLGKGGMERERLWMGQTRLPLGSSNNCLNEKPLVDSSLLSWSSVLYIVHWYNKLCIMHYQQRHGVIKIFGMYNLMGDGNIHQRRKEKNSFFYFNFNPVRKFMFSLLFYKNISINFILQSKTLFHEFNLSFCYL